jgi:hypothetical protein
MNKLVKFLLLNTVLSLTCLTCWAQGSQGTIVGPGYAIEFTVPTTTSVTNHSSGYVTLHARDLDEYKYPISTFPYWMWSYRVNTCGSITTSSSFGGSGVTITPFTPSAGDDNFTNYDFGISVDIGGTPPGSFIVTFTYSDGDPEQLGYDDPVSKELTVIIL